MKPIKNTLPIRELQTLLRQWRRKGLRESALLKVLELYLGLPNYMNEHGEYPSYFFYDLSVTLKFRTVTMMLPAVLSIRKMERFASLLPVLFNIPLAPFTRGMVRYGCCLPTTSGSRRKPSRPSSR